MKAVIEKYYGIDEDAYEPMSYPYCEGVDIEDFLYVPEQDTETKTAVSALIHKWHVTVDRMGMDIGAPDDYDKREWKLFLIDKSSRKVEEEYDWDSKRNKIVHLIKD